MTPDRYSRSVAWSVVDECFVALCPEFPDLSGVGETRAEAEAALEEAIFAAIEIATEERWPLPEPRTITEFSGQFRVRLPRSLHASLSKRAEVEDVSLNTLVATMLAEQIGTLNTFARVQRDIHAMMQDAHSVVREIRIAALGVGTATVDLTQKADRPIPMRAEMSVAARSFN